MLDPQDEQFDRRLARHLVSLYHQSQQDEEEEELVSKSLNDQTPEYMSIVCY